MALRSGAGPQQISTDSCCRRAACGPRKFWSDCKEVEHSCDRFVGGVVVRRGWKLSDKRKRRRREVRSIRFFDVASLARRSIARRSQPVSQLRGRSNII